MKFSANQQLPEPPLMSGNLGNDLRMMGNYIQQLRQSLQEAYENLYSDLDSGASRFTIHTSGDTPALSNTDNGQMKLYLSTNNVSGLIWVRMNDKMFYVGVPLVGV